MFSCSARTAEKGPKIQQEQEEPVKIKYISSPTMVKATSATEFMAIVQELTGKDSKVEDPFDAIEVASQVPGYGTPQFDVGSADGAFCNYTFHFYRTEDGIRLGEDCF
ncbi:sigma factor binding protein [Salix suchowensis]|nr:sigma factor binding protein [Salix suchowensis]